MNIAEIQELIWEGFVNVFGTSLIAVIVLLGFFAFLCISSRMSLDQAALVYIPVVFGIVTDGWLPIWIKGLIIIGMGLTWGLALLRIVRVS